MDTRFGRTVIILLWIGSATWLTYTKLLPIISTSNAPDLAIVANDDQQISEAVWKIYADDRHIGRATTRAEQQVDGATSVQSIVSIEELPVAEIVEQLLGPWKKLLSWNKSIPNTLRITFEARTNLALDSSGALQDFQTVVDLDHLGPLVEFRGQREGDTMTISVHNRNMESSAGGKPEQVLFETSVNLPQQAVVADAFSPHPRMANLTVGQRWQLHRYQAFPPGGNLRTLEARCTGTELFMWNGDIETVFIVTIRDATGAAPTASAGERETLWVRDDGTVLKQQMRLSNLLLEFRRAELRPTLRDES